MSVVKTQHGASMSVSVIRKVVVDNLKARFVCIQLANKLAKPDRSSNVVITFSAYEYNLLVLLEHHADSFIHNSHGYVYDARVS